MRDFIWISDMRLFFLICSLFAELFQRFEFTKIRMDITMFAAALLILSTLSLHYIEPSGDRTDFEVITDSKLVIKRLFLTWPHSWWRRMEKGVRIKTIELLVLTFLNFRTVKYTGFLCYIGLSLCEWLKTCWQIMLWTINSAIYQLIWKVGF